MCRLSDLSDDVLYGVVVPRLPDVRHARSLELSGALGNSGVVDGRACAAWLIRKFGNVLALRAAIVNGPCGDRHRHEEQGAEASSFVYETYARIHGVSAANRLVSGACAHRVLDGSLLRAFWEERKDETCRGSGGARTEAGRVLQSSLSMGRLDVARRILRAAAMTEKETEAEARTQQAWALPQSSPFSLDVQDMLRELLKGLANPPGTGLHFSSTMSSFRMPQKQLIRAAEIAATHLGVFVDEYFCRGGVSTPAAAAADAPAPVDSADPPTAACAAFVGQDALLYATSKCCFEPVVSALVDRAFLRLSRRDDVLFRSLINAVNSREQSAGAESRAAVVRHVIEDVVPQLAGGQQEQHPPQRHNGYSRFLVWGPPGGGGGGGGDDLVGLRRSASGRREDDVLAFRYIAELTWSVGGADDVSIVRAFSDAVAKCSRSSVHTASILAFLEESLIRRANLRAVTGFLIPRGEVLKQEQEAQKQQQLPASVSLLTPVKCRRACEAAFAEGLLGGGSIAAAAEKQRTELTRNACQIACLLAASLSRTCTCTDAREEGRTLLFDCLRMCRARAEELRPSVLHLFRPDEEGLLGYCRDKLVRGLISSSDDADVFFLVRRRRPPPEEEEDALLVFEAMLYGSFSLWPDALLGTLLATVSPVDVCRVLDGWAEYCGNRPERFHPPYATVDAKSVEANLTSIADQLVSCCARLFGGGEGYRGSDRSPPLSSSVSLCGGMARATASHLRDAAYRVRVDRLYKTWLVAGSQRRTATEYPSREETRCMWKEFGAFAVLNRIAHLHRYDMFVAATTAISRRSTERFLSLILLPEEGDDEDDSEDCRHHRGLSPSLLERAAGECCYTDEDDDYDGAASFWRLCCKILSSTAPAPAPDVTEDDNSSDSRESYYRANYDRVVSLILDVLVPRYYRRHPVAGTGCADASAATFGKDGEDEGGGEKTLSASNAAAWRFLMREMYLSVVDGVYIFMDRDAMLRFTTYVTDPSRPWCRAHTAFWNEARAALKALMVVTLSRSDDVFLRAEEMSRVGDMFADALPLPPRLLTTAALAAVGSGLGGGRKGGGALGFSEKHVRRFRQQAADGHGSVPLMFYALAGAGEAKRRAEIARTLREKAAGDAVRVRAIDELARKLADVALPADAPLYDLFD